MPVYPISTTNPEIASHYHPFLKPAILSVSLTIILTLCWYLFGLISQPLQEPGLWLSLNSQILKTLGILLILQAFLFISSSLAALLINPFIFKLLPLLGSSLILTLFYRDQPSAGVGVILAICLAQIIFSLQIAKDRNLYKKFSLRKLLLPPLTYLFLGTSLALTLPIYIHLQSHPDVTNNLLRYRLVEPMMDHMLKSSLSSPESPGSTSTPSDLLNQLSHIVPGINLSQIFPPEMLAQIQSPENSPPPENNSVNPTRNSKSIAPSKDLVKNEALNQFDNIIKPITPYLPIIFPLLIFFSILQTLLIIRPLFYPFIWIAFQLVLALHLAHITTQEEPVEVLEV